MSRPDASLEASPLRLPAVLDLLAAAPLCELLRGQVQSGAPLVLDGHEVERVSTPCLQLLKAASLKARARGVSFQLHSPSPTLTDALADLGLADGLVS